MSMLSVKMIIWLIFMQALQVVLCINPLNNMAQNHDGNQADLFYLVASYFIAGHSMGMICAFLHYHHGIRKSVRQLKRICRSLRLRRRCQESSEEDIALAIAQELDGGGSCVGYRAMWQRLVRDHHLHVKRETVRQFLSVMDPVGVESRRKHRLRRRVYSNKGPNYLIHIDGYDKLKPYGFAIHGAIDGFSRRVLWLEVGPTNNNPNVVAKYFVDYIRYAKGVPHILRSDRGSENSVIEKIQIALRFHHDDENAAYKSFLYGKSTRNQRIERWWGLMRSGGINYWINFFKDMCDSGALDNSCETDIECLRFCFMALVRADLHRISRLWNEHHVRLSRNTESHSGKPDEMFFLPQLFGAADYKHEIDVDQLDVIEEHYCLSMGENGCSDEFEAAVLLYMQQHNLEMPQTCYDALVLYDNLVQLFQQG